MRKLAALLTIFCYSTFFIANAQQGTYQKKESGVSITYKNTPYSIDQQLDITFISDSIVHVKSSPVERTVSPSDELILTDTIFGNSPVISVKEEHDQLLLHTVGLEVAVSLLNGQLVFLNHEGDTLLQEAPRDAGTFKLDAAGGDLFYRVKQDFQVDPQEGLYGLGQHQNGIMNYQKRQVNLLQYNTEVAVPMLVSTKNYGILWNNYAITKAGDTRPLLPLSALKLYAKTGEEGWLTATYLNKEHPDEVFTSRPESDIAYYYLSDLQKFPENIDLSKSLILYEGAISSPLSGLHRLHFKYAGYVKVWIDDKLVQNRWRESWNAGTFEVDLSFEANSKHTIKIEWKPEGTQSYLGVQCQRPLASAEQQLFSFDSEAGAGVDYYFFSGQNIDQVIGGYRKLTGKAPIMPLWSFGFWQSRERYKTQQEILAIAKEFRERNIPIDNLVLDWSYWKEKDWGSQDYDSTRFPDASGMIDQLHQNNYHFMISVWPKFNEESSTFDAFMNKGWLYRRNLADGRKDWIGEGYRSTFYDPFHEGARKGFWDLLNRKLYAKGVDAFWMDASEPDIHSNINIEERKAVFQPSIGSSTRYYNAFPLQNAKGIYEGQRETDPNKRVFILTRSAFAGQQRFAAATWSGDIASTWEDMKDQIAAGINFSMSGLPYWTMDAGGFLVEKKYHEPNDVDLEEWRELNARWYQFGTFLPIFRAHGQYPYREPFNIAPSVHPAYKSMIASIQLRYRLLPYIYSLAGKIYHEDYTMMRGLAMDFSTDKKVYNINDQFLLGPSLLVNPVTKKGFTERSVYLPNDISWYDLYTGAQYPGGQTIQAAAPYERIPVFVKAGSILPIGPILQHTEEKTSIPLTLYVYDGADGIFALYEDDGKSYGYEKGIFNTITFHYNQQDKELSISKRKGQYADAPSRRTFNIVFVDANQRHGIEAMQTKNAHRVNYTGKPLKIKLQ
ncbi:DUF5110 domain-containing protein [Olivibacter sp. SDN3]|uniref:glycoside hydrolase family 31 protein n=1 Tax=Olivibacter sp. SDN3 TaxID=2764720 RepID=UPI0016510EC3|nr:TIM-barrel domain-containing protein [Olivibacter sp. SDN3]QNL49449.1 DUF5110 domain-containing protein [Olivibacter sp. SDN3]